jgi:hypothetical protein
MNRMASSCSSRCWNIGVLLACLISLMAIFEIVRAQSGGRPDGQSGGQSRVQSRGTITGRVVISDAGVAARATVLIRTVGENRSGASQSVQVDDDGNFRFDNLAPRLYTVNAYGVPGYISAFGFPTGRGMPQYYQVGDIITINLVKGGAITGRVTYPNGEPVIGIAINPIMRRDSDGNALQFRDTGYRTFTDDRGIYRLYGLTPGSYIVAANWHQIGLGMTLRYNGETPAYYPSSTIDTAVEIAVKSGGEVTGIDIQYPGEPGHVVSGTVFGAGANSGPLPSGMNVRLVSATTGILVSTSLQGYSGNKEGYAIYGVQDGEYEVIAGWSTTRRITVKGADLTGVDLKLMQLSTLSGRIVLPSEVDNCKGRRKPTFQEFLPIILRDSEEKTSEALRFMLQSSGRRDMVDENGEFTLRSLIPSRYRLGVRMPDESLYLSSIVLTSSSSEPTGRSPSRSGVPAGVNLARAGITIKPGESVSGVVATLAYGAAGLRGKIVAGKGTARTPSRLRLHLIPSESAAADNLLRYAETIAHRDGSFTFSNIAPGKYRLIARPVPGDEIIDNPPRQLSWDDGERAKLRREAEMVKDFFELKPCQRVNDYILRISF